MTTIEIPIALPSLANARVHWRARAALVRRQRTIVFFCMLGLERSARAVGPVGDARRIIITLTRIAPRPIRDRHDNLPAACKGVVDEIAACLGLDDADPRIEWRYGQAKGPASVRVEFEVVNSNRAPPTGDGGDRVLVRGKSPDARLGGAAKSRAFSPPKSRAVSAVVRNR